MVKLTKKQIRQLQAIEEHLNRAEKYLRGNDVVGIAIKIDYPNGASYVIQNTACHEVHAVNVVQKFTGSELTRLITAHQSLSEFIKQEA